MHFYIIFGTNLLTQSPVPVFPLFQCFEEKEYQTESKRNETFGGSYFWKESNPGDLECTSGKKGGALKGGGRAPCLVAPPSVHRRTSFTHIYLRIVKLPERRLDLDFRSRKPL